MEELLRHSLDPVRGHSLRDAVGDRRHPERVPQAVDRIGSQAQQARAVRVYTGERAGLLERLLGAVNPRADRMATPGMGTP